MPLINVRLEGKGKTEDGQEVVVPGQVVLEQRGPVVQVTITPLEKHQQALIDAGVDSLPSYSGLALIDTGAQTTCIDRNAAESAGLAIVGTGFISSATHEKEEVPQFAGKIDIAGFAPNINVLNGLGVNLSNQGLVALIGRDVLKAGILVYNGVDGSFTYSM